MIRTSTTSTATPPVRLSAPSADRVLIVVGGDVPNWVVRWCTQSGRELHHEPATRWRPGELTCAAEKITEIAARAARSGGAVLVLPDAQPHRPGRPRVVAAVRHLPDDAQTLADAAASAEHLGADLVVAHGLPTSFGERSIGLDAAVDGASHLLQAAVEAASASTPGLTVQPWLARVHPHELVGEGLDADLLVLGGPRINAPGQLGLVARSALFHAPCPVLLAPRLARSTSGLWAPPWMGERPLCHSASAEPRT